MQRAAHGSLNWAPSTFRSCRDKQSHLLPVTLGRGAARHRQRPPTRAPSTCPGRPGPVGPKSRPSSAFGKRMASLLSPGVVKDGICRVRGSRRKAGVSAGQGHAHLPRPRPLQPAHRPRRTGPVAELGPHLPVRAGHRGGGRKDTGPSHEKALLPFS